MLKVTQLETLCELQQAKIVSLEKTVKELLQIPVTSWHIPTHQMKLSTPGAPGRRPQGQPGNTSADGPCCAHAGGGHRGTPNSRSCVSILACSQLSSWNRCILPGGPRHSQGRRPETSSPTQAPRHVRWTPEEPGFFFCLRQDCEESNSQGEFHPEPDAKSQAGNEKPGDASPTKGSLAWLQLQLQQHCVR